MKNFLRFLVFLFLIYTFIIIILYPDNIKQNIFDVFDLWLNKVLISLVPMFLLSNILISYPYISKILYPILDKILHFENERSCSLFILTVITGNPTSSILVIDSVEKNDISVSEGNRLLKCTILSSPLFIITMMGNYGYLIIIISIFVNMILFYKKNVNKNYKKNIINNNSLLDVIDRCPTVMLEILSSMVFITIFKIPLLKLIHYLNFDNIVLLNYFIDSLELTTGLNNIGFYQTAKITQVLLSKVLISMADTLVILL